MRVSLLVVCAGFALVVAHTAVAVDPEPAVHGCIIPHSHCDAGWLVSFQDYYEDRVSRILEAMAAELIRDSSRRFIWSEVSFFALWWSREGNNVAGIVPRLFCL